MTLEQPGNPSPRAAHPSLSYTAAGVDTGAADAALSGLLPAVRSSFALRTGIGRPVLPIGYFANVLDLGGNAGLAISTDGVGTKLIVAELMDKYDTIGIDCVAMNVNDVICVGAEPIAMTDYLAVQAPDRRIFAEIGAGLLRGAEESGITIPGGEISQISEMLRGVREGSGLDLVGTCVGTVPLDRLLVGQAISDGDVVLGLASSGVHSNGLTLARRALIDRGGFGIDRHVPEFGRTAGEELLEPTRIYVRFANAIVQSGVPVKALAHITSDGLLNLTRVQAQVGYVIEALPELPPVFQLIQRCGAVPDEEMFRVFNMGVGLCAVVAPEGVNEVRRIAASFDHATTVLGVARPDPERRVHIPAKKLVGAGRAFVRA